VGHRMLRKSAPHDAFVVYLLQILQEQAWVLKELFLDHEHLARIVVHFHDALVHLERDVLLLCLAVLLVLVVGGPQRVVLYSLGGLLLRDSVVVAVAI